MSISSALSNAISGLTVSSKAADIVSSNIANAMTDGYGVRELNISSRAIAGHGAGARVTGVTRHEDAILTGQRRQADAELSSHATQAGFLTRLENLIGTPDQAGSLSARAARFEANLVAAANSPQSEARLLAAVQAAGALVGQINGISEGIQAERLQADSKIATRVEQINTSLAQLAALNTRIRQGDGGGRDVSALMDAQAQLLDDISPLIPLHTRRDSNSALQIYSQDGHAFLDGRPSVLSFSPASVMTPEMTLASGDLSGLTLNGYALPTNGGKNALSGGELGALFDLRDQTAVEAQSRIDAVARDLAGRFDQAGLDPTIAAGAPGLFTDAGSAVSAAAELGLAGRLSLNTAVVSDQGTAPWRLRDGLGAATEGPVGQSDFLLRQVDSLTALVSTASGGFSNAARSFAALVSDHLSLTGLARQVGEVDHTHAATRHAALRQEELAMGVDTDTEMQRLLQIEQAFSANARVISAAEQMLDELMRVGR